MFGDAGALAIEKIWGLAISSVVQPLAVSYDQWMTIWSRPGEASTARNWYREPAETAKLIKTAPIHWLGLFAGGLRREAEKPAICRSSILQLITTSVPQHLGSVSMSSVRLQRTLEEGTSKQGIGREVRRVISVCFVCPLSAFVTALRSWRSPNVYRLVGRHDSVYELASPFSRHLSQQSISRNQFRFKTVSWPLTFYRRSQ